MRTTSYRSRGNLGRVGRLVLAAAIGLAGCTAGAAPPAGAPVADPAAMEAEIRAATAPGSPRHATFTWRLDEAGSRVRGSGAARYVAPERLRVDLFGQRGETYLAAALVGEEFRLPPGAREAFPLPSPALLWAALGVVRPPADAQLEHATRDGARAVLRYALPDGGALEFRVQEADEPRLESVERIGRSGVIESVRIERSAAGELQRITYQDRTAYRELVLESEGIQDVASFPESIWSPGSGR